MEKKFKPYDRVLVRDGYGVWGCDLYSHWDKNKKSHCTVGFGSGIDISDEEILSFEEYSHLLGKTDSPDEEVRLEKGEWVMCAAGPYDNPTYWILIQFDKTRETKFIGANGGDWSYAIRFSDFNPNDMEETMKHILCVRNGRIVKYKN